MCSGGFLAHHLARISMAAVYWDAQHIDEGVRFLKQHARPHALARRCHYALTRPAAAGCCTSTGPEAVSRIPPVGRSTYKKEKNSWPLAVFHRSTLVHFAAVVADAPTLCNVSG